MYSWKQRRRLKLDGRFRKADVVLAEVVGVRLPVDVAPHAVLESILSKTFWPKIKI
jgi:hypothetical protein